MPDRESDGPKPRTLPFREEVLDCCVACRSCELACSYHHLGGYQPSRASIEIRRDMQSGEILRRVWYARDGERLGCDACQGEEELQCERYCSRPAVRELLRRRAKGGSR